jgi:hypothetical protein
MTTSINFESMSNRELGIAMLHLADELVRRHGHDEACRLVGVASIAEVEQMAAKAIASCAMKTDGT